jgi:hypothetical protein
MSALLPAPEPPTAFEEKTELPQVANRWQEPFDFAESSGRSESGEVAVESGLTERDRTFLAYLVDVTIASMIKRRHKER